MPLQRLRSLLLFSKEFEATRKIMAQHGRNGVGHRTRTSREDHSSAKSISSRIKKTRQFIVIGEGGQARFAAQASDGDQQSAEEGESGAPQVRAGAGAAEEGAGRERRAEDREGIAGEFVFAAAADGTGDAAGAGGGRWEPQSAEFDRDSGDSLAGGEFECDGVYCEYDDAGSDHGDCVVSCLRVGCLFVDT